MLLAVVAAAFTLGAAPLHPERHPHALWRVIDDLCVPDKKLTGLPAPCLKVDLAAGYAIVPDPNRQTQILLVPTRRIAGIETRELLAPGGPNYWALAWRERGFFIKRANQAVPSEMIGMAINSQAGRTQDQLHIHLDCLRRGVRTALDSHSADISHTWSVLPVKLRGHSYSAMWANDLNARDPFAQLAEKSSVAKANMGLQTMAVMPTHRGDTLGFVLLSRAAHPDEGDLGAGEELLDHHCEILAVPKPKRSDVTPVSHPVVTRVRR